MYSLKFIVFCLLVRVLYLALSVKCFVFTVFCLYYEIYIVEYGIWSGNYVLFCLKSTDVKYIVVWSV